MECLFDADKPHFATWLWIYSDDHWGDPMLTMCPTKPEAFPLYYAAMLGFRDLAEHLIAEHPDHVNAQGGRELTPMHAAARAGHVDILSLLLDNGAEVDGRGIIGQTPLHRVSWNGTLEAGKRLLDRGADVNARMTMVPPHCFQRRTMEMSTLLECYLNTGRGLMSRMTPAKHRCTGQ